MAHSSTVLSQIIRILPRHEFQSLADKHHVGGKFRGFSRWTQFVALLTAQLSGRTSLRDVVANLRAQREKLYHLGVKPTSKSTLSRANNEQPQELYGELFQRLLARCQQIAPRNKTFTLKGKVYLLDSTLVTLTLSLFPWASYQKAKGAAKLHVGLDADGYLPAFIDMTDGKTADIESARKMKLPRDSYIVFDRGYTDYEWYQELTDNGVFFVTRLKTNAAIKEGKKRRGRKSPGVSGDCEIELGKLPDNYRLVTYTDDETNITYRFLTNATELQAKTIADLYKERWQIELFFKWIKQNLRVKSFLGASENAVMTQLWVALCAYLMCAFLIFQSKMGLSMRQLLRVLQLNLFEKRDLWALFRPPDKVLSCHNKQLGLI
jgi:IS4 transposase